MTPKLQQCHDEIMYLLNTLDQALEREHKEQRSIARTEKTLDRLTTAIHHYFWTARKDLPYEKRWGRD